jgi:hypothetical protein
VTRETPRKTEGRILPFRPRGSLFARGLSRPPPVEDLGKFERTPAEPDDYRHRMLMNGLALLATVVLVVIGIWIADTMAQMRKNQDCYLAGRPACNQMPVPTPQR